MDQRRSSSFEVSSATSNIACSARTTQQCKIEGPEDSFAALVKPFDCMEGDRDLPASRAYSKVLDITSPTGSPTNKKVDTDGPGGNDKDSHRPWPEPDKHQNGSKRKRETNSPGLCGPTVHHRQDDGPLQRWLHEAPTEGPYHGIADASEDTCVPRAAKDNNTKKYQG